MTVCNKGLVQTFIPGLLGSLVFGEMLFYLFKISILLIGKFFHYNFPKNYWTTIELILPPTAVIFFSMLIQKKGNVSNMFKDIDIPKVGISLPIHFTPISSLPSSNEESKNTSSPIKFTPISATSTTTTPSPSTSKKSNSSISFTPVS